MAAMHATDVMDKIHITATVRMQDDWASQPREVLFVATTLQGCGEDDYEVWLKDALVALLEVL